MCVLTSDFDCHVLVSRWISVSIHDVIIDAKIVCPLLVTDFFMPRWIGVDVIRSVITLEGVTLLEHLTILIGILTSEDTTYEP